MLSTYTIFSSLHAMTGTTMSPSTGPEGISLHAVIFMLRKVEYTSDINRGPEPCQSGTILTFPSLPTLELSLDGAVWAYAHAHDDYYLTR